MLGGMLVEKEKNDFLGWVKQHKKQLILAGISISVVIGIILGAKNKKILEELWETLKKSTKNELHSEFKTIPLTPKTLPENDVLTIPRNYTLPQEPVEVGMHIRTLTGGRVHSAEKAAKAKALGILLLPNQTLVDPYTKYAA